MKLLAFHLEHSDAVRDALRNLGVHVVEASVQADPNDYDAMVVYVGPGVSIPPYRLAQAVACQKPVLCFYAADTAVSAEMNALKKNESLKPLLHARKIGANPVSDVSTLLKEIERGDLAEVPSIKFTLRLTPTMERYLQWKSQQTGLSKADVLRNFVETDLIAKDKDFPG